MKHKNEDTLKVSKKELLEKCRILIVEDDYIGRTVIMEIFKNIGFQTIIEAENGRIGLEKAREFNPHLILMDVEMPEMDGITCCQHIRQDPKLKDTVILVQTSLNKTDDKARIFEAGADDYLAKPVDPYEITARAIIHLERVFMTQRLKDYHDRVQNELDMARQAQQVLLPNEKVIEQAFIDHNIKIKSHFETSSELGGDFWGLSSLSSQKLALYLVDFTGHGVHAALNTFRFHTLMQNNQSLADQPGPYLTSLNAHLAPLLPTGQFATMFYGVIDFRDKVFSYASASAPYPILLRDHASAAEPLRQNNLPIGVHKNKSYNTNTTDFNPGDMLFLYSDALIETPNLEREFLDVDTIAFLLQEYCSTGDRFDLDAGFAKFVKSFLSRSDEKIADDLTLNVYHWTDPEN
ncbi:MAG: SpoIIE family protein phosphatase [Pseudomonadota bacterium]